MLRAFDAARANYHVLLHTSEVAAALAGLHASQPDCPDPADLELLKNGCQGRRPACRAATTVSMRVWVPSLRIALRR